MRSAAVAAGAGLGFALAALATAAVERVVVTGDSMRPTLLRGDRLLVRRGRRRAVPGALVVVGDPRAPSRRVVKRVSEVGPAGAVVLGDNPAASTDSRTWGPVPWELVHGTVVYRYAPGDRVGRCDRAGRVAGSEVKRCGARPAARRWRAPRRRPAARRRR